MRSVDSLALQVLREIERTIISGNAYEILITVPIGVELFLLNQKRNALVAIENRYSVVIQIIHDAALKSPNFVINVQSERPRKLKIATPTIDVDQDEDHSVDEEDSFESNEADEKADEKEKVIDRNTEATGLVKKKSKRNNNRRRRHNRRPASDESGAENLGELNGIENGAVNGGVNETVNDGVESSGGHSSSLASRQHQGETVAAKAEQGDRESGPISKDGVSKDSSSKKEDGSNLAEEGQSDRRPNNNRRRRHPYQRRHMKNNRPEDGNENASIESGESEPNRGENSRGEPNRGETNRGEHQKNLNAQREQTKNNRSNSGSPKNESPKTESSSEKRQSPLVLVENDRPVASSVIKASDAEVTQTQKSEEVGTAKTKNKKQPKGWLRRLLDT